MKRAVITLFAAMMLVTGCGGKAERKTEYLRRGRFAVLETMPTWAVVVDVETGVMYTVSNGGRNRGTFTMLVDADGKPLLWKGNADADHD